MSKLLYIKASPREERSFSVAAADSFLDAYHVLHPEDDITILDLFERDLPPFDGFALQAKYAILHGRESTPEEKAAWEAVEEVIREFTDADKYVFAVPMWNFHLPYRLKHYIDVLVQPSYTFSFSPTEGYKGLVPDRPVFIAFARGGSYPPGSGTEMFDFQTRYLKHVLHFIGLTDIREVVIEPTLGDPAATQEKREAAIHRARKMAESF